MPEAPRCSPRTAGELPLCRAGRVLVGGQVDRAAVVAASNAQVSLLGVQTAVDLELFDTASVEIEASSCECPGPA